MENETLINSIPATDGNTMLAADGGIDKMTVIIDAMKNVTPVIATMKESSKAGWVGYILECIDSDLGEEWLPEIKKMIDERLSNGRW